MWPLWGPLKECLWPSLPVRAGQSSWPHSWPSHTIYSGAEVINIGVTPNFQAWILLTYFSFTRLSMILSTNISLRFYLLLDRYISIGKEYIYKRHSHETVILLQGIFSTKNYIYYKPTPNIQIVLCTKAGSYFFPFLAILTASASEMEGFFR